jgi:hypothetical protein
MSRILMFTAPHCPNGEPAPGVCMFEERGVRVAIYGNRAADALAVARRASSDSAYPVIHAKRFNYLEFQRSLVMGLEKPPHWLNGRTFRLDAGHVVNPATLTPQQIMEELNGRAMENIYFAVGGPITREITPAKATGYLIL